MNVFFSNCDRQIDVLDGARTVVARNVFLTWLNWKKPKGIFNIRIFCDICRIRRNTCYILKNLLFFRVRRSVMRYLSTNIFLTKPRVIYLLLRGFLNGFRRCKVIYSHCKHITCSFSNGRLSMVIVCLQLFNYYKNKYLQ